MTRRVIQKPVEAFTQIDWKSSLAKLAYGERLLVKGRTQASVGATVADHNKDGKRFVTKKMPTGVLVIRVQ